MADLHHAHLRRCPAGRGARLGSEGDLAGKPKTLAPSAADAGRADGEEASASGFRVPRRASLSSR
jgi:hypothetical protein